MLLGLKKKISWLLHLIYPKKCIFCGEIIDYGIDKNICSACVEKYKQITGNKCELCGRPIPVNNICVQCRGKKHYYEKCYCVYEYKDKVKRFVHNMKFYGVRQNCYYAAMQMQLFYHNNGIESCDYVVPVPMFSLNRIGRGYNHAQLIAKTFSRLTGIKYKNALCKYKHTLPQHRLKGNDRLKNLKNAFCVNKNVKDKTILLIDDVYTTGSTVNECSRMLKKAGARAVYVFCFCVVTDD